MTTINITGEKITIKNPVIGGVEAIDSLEPKFTKTIKATFGDRVQVKFPIGNIPLLRAVFLEDILYSEGSRDITRFDVNARIRINVSTEPPHLVNIDFTNSQFMDWNSIQSTVENDVVTYEFDIFGTNDETGVRELNLYGTDSAEFKIV